MIGLEKLLVAASFNKEEKNKDGTNAVIMFFVHIGSHVYNLVRA